MLDRVRTWILTLSLALLAISAARIALSGSSVVPYAYAGEPRTVQCLTVDYKSADKATASLAPLTAAGKEDMFIFVAGMSYIACGW